MSVNVTVVVQTPPYNGASSYKVDISKPVIDLAITSGASASDLLASKVTTLRLAEYRGGVFYQYVNIASVRISKADNIMKVICQRVDLQQNLQQLAVDQKFRFLRFH